MLMNNVNFIKLDLRSWPGYPRCLSYKIMNCLQKFLTIEEEDGEGYKTV